MRKSLDPQPLGAIEVAALAGSAALQRDRLRTLPAVFASLRRVCLDDVGPAHDQRRVPDVPCDQWRQRIEFARTLPLGPARLQVAGVEQEAAIPVVNLGVRRRARHRLLEVPIRVRVEIVGLRMQRPHGVRLTEPGVELEGTICRRPAPPTRLTRARRSPGRRAGSSVVPRTRPVPAARRAATAAPAHEVNARAQSSDRGRSLRRPGSARRRDQRQSCGCATCSGPAGTAARTPCPRSGACRSTARSSAPSVIFNALAMCPAMSAWIANTSSSLRS